MAGGLAESSDRYFKFPRLHRVVREEAHLEVRADIALAPLRVLRLEVTGLLWRQQLLMRNANRPIGLVPVMASLLILFHWGIELPFPPPLLRWTFAAAGTCAWLKAQAHLVLFLPAALLPLFVWLPEARIHCGRRCPPNVWAVQWRSLKLAQCSLELFFLPLWKQFQAPLLPWHRSAESSILGRVLACSLLPALCLPNTHSHFWLLRVLERRNVIVKPAQGGIQVAALQVELELVLLLQNFLEAQIKVPWIVEQLIPMVRQFSRSPRAHRNQVGAKGRAPRRRLGSIPSQPNELPVLLPVSRVAKMDDIHQLLRRTLKAFCFALPRSSPPSRPFFWIVRLVAPRSLAGVVGC